MYMLLLMLDAPYSVQLQRVFVLVCACLRLVVGGKLEGSIVRLAVTT
jgi:hypothetical protein